jgi:hypothetical protein
MSPNMRRSWSPSVRRAPSHIARSHPPPPARCPPGPEYSLIRSMNLPQTSSSHHDRSPRSPNRSRSTHATRPIRSAYHPAPEASPASHDGHSGLKVPFVRKGDSAAAATVSLLPSQGQPFPRDLHSSIRRLRASSTARNNRRARRPSLKSAGEPFVLGRPAVCVYSPLPPFIGALGSCAPRSRPTVERHSASR